MLRLWCAIVQLSLSGLTDIRYLDSLQKTNATNVAVPVETRPLAECISSEAEPSGS